VGVAVIYLARKRLWLIPAIIAADIIVAPFVVTGQYALFHWLLGLPYVEAGR
jgi:hypothetical protein